MSLKIPTYVIIHKILPTCGNKGKGGCPEKSVKEWGLWEVKAERIYGVIKAKSSFRQDIGLNT